jgi:hypothetical protein
MRLALALVLLLIPAGSGALVTTVPLPAPVPCGACWHPTVREAWQIQLSGGVNTSVGEPIDDIDYQTPLVTVDRLRNRGVHLICYVDAGGWENYRPDRGTYPKSVLGRIMQGWPDERWVDIRRVGVLLPILRKRADTCKRHGFSAIDWDDVDGYQNATGFPLTAGDQLRFNTALANMTHRLGLAVGLKNDVDQTDRLAPYFDFAVNEQCFDYQECSRLEPFINAAKPVFQIEYHSFPRLCARSLADRFSTLVKHLSLDNWRRAC